MTATQYPILINTITVNHLYQNGKKWIGVGKKNPLSGEVPSFIEEARSKVLAIPPIYSPHIPSPKMSITDLLKAKLPIYI